MKKILNRATIALFALGIVATPTIAFDDVKPSFDDHFWELVEGSGPIKTIFGVSIQSNNVVSLTTSPTGNITAVIRGNHTWIESMGGTARYERPDGTYDTITLVN